MPSEISRRKALKRGALIGAAVWTPPIVSSFRVPAMGQVGSPRPEPSPTPTETPTGPPPEPTPTPTPTQTSTQTPTPSPTTTPPTQVGGVTYENPNAGGEGLAHTGQSLMGPTIAGAAFTAVGAGMRAAAKKRAASTGGDPTPDAH